jgi:FkbM family methyltransferase
MGMRQQIKSKVKSHGVAATVYYCFLGAVFRVFKPFREHVLRSYAQAGEDVVLDRLLGRRADGFYIDIGAHNPVRLSNTKRFYDRGWSGINIEPNPVWHRLFMEQRPRDINLCLGVAGSVGEMTYYEMDYPGLSTFDPEQLEVSKGLGAQLVATHQVQVRTLDGILDEYLNRPIDFMSIDVEGFEYQVLDNNNWDRYRPRLICIECVSDEDTRNEPVLKERDAYFEKIGYQRKAVTRTFGRVINAIYADMQVSDNADGRPE